MQDFEILGMFSVGRAQETEAAVRERLREPGLQFDAEVAQLARGYDAAAEALETVSVKPKAADIVVHFTGPAWVPCELAHDGRLRSLPFPSS